MARRKLRIDAVAEVEPTLNSSEPAEARSVGATLRDARERRGWSVADIAQQLRIRPAVLEAMESGRFEKLPNGAYALGFVRSYADFLGLDRDEIAQRVKAEAAALSARTELGFPKPLTESRMPSGVVLIVSLVLAVGGYGLWYYHSANTRLAPPRVEAVPPQLAAQAEASKPSPRAAEAATVAPSAGEPGLAAPGAATPDTAPAMAAKSAASAPATTEATAPTAAIGSSPSPASVANPSSSTAPAAPSAASEATPSAPATSTPQIAALPAKPGAAAPAEPAAAASKPAPSPKQYGATDGSARIVLKATADSWVQVRDREGKVVFSRILRPGDTYAVPNQPGLIMATGSAGALNILVDGKRAPSIGRVGFTQKNVPLDPERLLSGTAVVERHDERRTPAQKPAAPKENPGASPSTSAPSNSNG